MNSSELIKKFLNERLDSVPENITPDSLLVDLGVDSLMLAELMFEAEDKLEISIDSDVTPPKTVGEMTALIDALVARKKAK
jgi:acyl carrier protein